MSGSNVSLAGIAAATGIIVWFTIYWWIREGHKPKKIVTFLLAIAYGILAVLGTAGAWSGLGAVAWGALWLNNLAGYAGLVWGVGGTDQNVTRAAQIVLTPGGYVILFLCTVVLAALVKFSKVSKNKVIFGFVAGCGLGLSGSIAGVAAIPLASAANMLGSGFTGVFS
jgi:hypothetical protein